MELTQIRYFMAVAQCENMSRAAEQCHVSQPSLSKSIAKLEAEIGCDLFNRSGKHITLNENGRRFLRGASSMVWELDNAVYDVRQMAHKTVSHVTVGLAVEYEPICAVLCAYAREHPEVRLDVETGLKRLREVDINQYDMLLYPDSSRYKKLRGQEVGMQRFLFAFGRKYRDARQLAGQITDGRIDMQVLDNREFVFIRHAPEHVEFAWDACARLGIHVVAQAFTDSFDMHRKLIESGCACGFVETARKTEFDPDQVIFAEPSGGYFERGIKLCFKRPKRLSATGTEFRDFVLERLPAVQGA